MNYDHKHAQLKVEALHAEAEARRQAKLAREAQPRPERPSVLLALRQLLRPARRSTV